jgi:hypothetical protein
MELSRAVWSSSKALFRYSELPDLNLDRDTGLCWLTVFVVVLSPSKEKLG